jgi:hypothetical protein
MAEGKNWNCQRGRHFNSTFQSTNVGWVGWQVELLANVNYGSTGIVRFLTHILCVSSWIMGDGWMEYVYWLLVNFPDNLVASCTSIEQVNLPPSQIGKMYYINTGIFIFRTHILCVSSWIMGDGWMEYIYWLLMNFPDNLVITCISIGQVNLPPSHIGKIYYSNTGIVKFLTHMLCVSSWIMDDGRM